MVSRINVNQLFLQSMLTRGAVPEKLARKIWQKCTQAVNAVDNSQDIPIVDDDASWNHFISAINHSLDRLDLAFRSVRDQKTGQTIYSIINMKGDTVAQTATDYTAAEIAYFKAIVEQIMLSPRHKYSVSSLVALREVSMIKPKSNITKSQAEVVLASFVAKGWLTKSKDGRYSLSSRSLLELRPYLQSNYPGHILLCSTCEEMLTVGIACYHEGCKCRMHPYCFKRYLRARTRANGPPTCKNCNQDWPRDFDSDLFIPIGDKAVRKGEHEQRVRMNSASDEEDNYEEDGDEDVASQPQSLPTQQPTQTQGRKGGKSKKTGKKGAAAEENNDEYEDAGPSESTQSRPRRRTRN